MEEKHLGVVSKRKVNRSLRYKSYPMFSLKMIFSEDVYFSSFKNHILSISCNCKVMQSADVGLASVNKAVRKMKLPGTRAQVYLPRALVNSKNLTLSLASFFFGVLEKGWMGKLGWTGGKGRKIVEVFFYRTAEVSVLYLVFGLVLWVPC